MIWVHYNWKFGWFHFIFYQSYKVRGCNHNLMSQRWWRTQGLHFRVVIFTFSYKGFLGWNLLQRIIKNTSQFSIHHIFCINFSWITKNFFKMYKFYQMMRFVLKIYRNFKLYENMLVIWWFILLFHKLQLCFRYHVHYTPFICGKGFLKFLKKFNIKISNFTTFKLWVFFECG